MPVELVKLQTRDTYAVAGNAEWVAYTDRDVSGTVVGVVVVHTTTGESQRLDMTATQAVGVRDALTQLLGS